MRVLCFELPLYFLFGFCIPLCNAKSVWLCGYLINVCLSNRSLSLSCRDEEVEGLCNEAHEERSLVGTSVRSVRFFKVTPYRDTSLIRKRTPLGPYRRPMPRVLGGSQGGGCFLMGEVPLYVQRSSRLDMRQRSYLGATWYNFTIATCKTTFETLAIMFCTRVTSK